jgi:hypothetical protein
MPSPLIRLVGTLALAGSALYTRLLAQSADEPDHLLPQGWEVSAWAGGGTTVATRPLGGVADRGLLLCGIAATRPVANRERVALAYFAEWLPLAVATRTPRSAGVWLYSWGRFDSLYADGSDRRAAVPGMGLVPVGFRASIALGAALVAFAEASGGVIAFASNVPGPSCRRLNLLATAGLGVRFPRRSRPGFLAGYRFVHVSNAHTAPSNPGLNAHVVYVGIAVR